MDFTIPVSRGLELESILLAFESEENGCEANDLAQSEGEILHVFIRV